MASQNVSNNVKTSLGPVGLDQVCPTNVFDITRNPVTACQAASKNIKTSLLDQMLMDDTFGDNITVSTDCAAIFKMLEIEHPAANVKTSVGPVGLDRMLMDDTFGDNITVSTDCAAIFKMLEAEHPATKNSPEKGCEDECLSKLKRRLKNKLKSRRFTQKY